MEAFQKLKKELVHYEPKPTSRLESHQAQTKFAFVISPFGKGYDCHRTWEALMLGCIPIVRHSGLDPLFNGLPVLLINDWSDVTEELLNHTIQSFRMREFQYDKLKLQYWVQKFR